MKHLLTMVHDNGIHYEWWYLEGDHVHVRYECPLNYPSRGEHDLDFGEAVRQYCLMTSTESWMAENASGWHDLVDWSTITLKRDDKPVRCDRRTKMNDLFEILSDDREHVDLIASGYEWICPECEVYNTEIELVDEVTCEGCGKTFPVREAHHAHG